MSPPGGGVNAGLKSCGMSPPGWTAGWVCAVRPMNAATRNANLLRRMRLPFQARRMARLRAERQDAPGELLGRDRLRAGRLRGLVPLEPALHEHEEQGHEEDREEGRG